jgi:hypothetical protein
MPTVIGKEVQKNKGMCASMHDESVFIGHPRCETKGAVSLRRLLAVLYVGHTVRGPQTLEFVWDSSKSRRGAEVLAVEFTLAVMAHRSSAVII